MTETRICLTLFSQLNGETDDKYIIKDIENSIDSNFMVVIKMRKVNVHVNRGNDLIMQIHDRKEKLYEYYRKGSFNTRIDQSALSLISYRKTVVQYMFEPKGKGCFRNTTKDKCLNECKIHLYIEQTGQYPGTYAAEDTKLNLNFSDLKTSVNLNDCSKRCSHRIDCYKEHFIVQGNKGGLYNQSNEHQMLIEFPAHPTTIYEISLKMCFEEYLCLIASIFSLWFGFSILAFNEFFGIFIKHIYQSYNRANIIQINLKNKKVFNCNFLTQFK